MCSSRKLSQLLSYGNLHTIDYLASWAMLATGDVPHGLTGVARKKKDSVTPA